MSEYNQIIIKIPTHRQNLYLNDLVTIPFFSDDLIDCGDSSCCSHPVCAENILCVYFADPEKVCIYL